MNIDKVKNQILELKKYKLKIKLNIGRNKFEYYEGYIRNIYPNIFIIETNKGFKSFTYSDVITKLVTLTKFN